jgi:arginine-tRNA-protein transferase
MRKVPLVDTDIIEFSTLQSPCVYLKGKKMKMAYKYIKDCSLPLSSKLVQRGWRRFGHYYSRPECDNCNACQSMRIDVNGFQLSKSAKRIIKKNSTTRIMVRKPSISQDHLNLYEKYHRYMQEKKGWEYYPVNAESYADLYAKGFSSYGYEILYIRDQKLVGVDLVDFLEDGLSAIYFYYDPDYAHLSLGRYSIYKQIEMAKVRELSWIYLGYYVKECESLNYKDSYKPNQILMNNPTLSEHALWE